MPLTRPDRARVVGLELARAAALLASATLLVGFGMRWCMPLVFETLAARFVLPEVPDWPAGLWLFLGAPWLV
ncbi:MAG TPA: hypothetical protein VFZ61_25065, partial [Polyangiales bacterium]